MQSGITIERDAEAIRAWLQASNISHAEIARATGLDEKLIRQFRDPEKSWNPKLDTLTRLAALVPAPKPKRRRKVAA